MSAEEQVKKVPDLILAQKVFLLETGCSEKKEDCKKTLMESIKKNSMAPFYNFVCDKFDWTKDETLYKTLSKANEDELKSIGDKLSDAELNLGETEISDALILKAEYLTAIGDKDAALAAWEKAYEKTAPLGTRIDMVLTMIRIGFFFFDNELVTRNIERARTLIEEGGDWDRRNRLRVYEGAHKLSVRDFRGAAELLLTTLATFTCTELFDYKTFVRYTVLAAALTLDRPETKKKIIQAPEVLEVIHDIPHLESFINSLYKCKYDTFFNSLAAIESTLKEDFLLYRHAKYYVREMRIIAYTQLLESYRSVTIEKMAASFGVSTEFIDADLSRFIAASRLNAVIDKVSDVIETNRPDSKNAQYQNCIKQGDVLLTRIQKLGRVINV